MATERTCEQCHITQTRFEEQLSSIHPDGLTTFQRIEDPMDKNPTYEVRHPSYGASRVKIIHNDFSNEPVIVVAPPEEGEAMPVEIVLKSIGLGNGNSDVA